MSITQTSISRPVTITMLFIGIAFMGIFAFTKLGIDLLPNISLLHLVVQTSYSNAAPEEIEKLITEPLESAIGTVTGVKKITSVSKEGIAVIMVDFLWGTNMDMAVLSLREKLDNIRFALPRDAGRPTIIRANPNAEPIVSLALQFRSQKSEFRSQNSKIRNQNLDFRRRGLESRRQNLEFRSQNLESRSQNLESRSQSLESRSQSLESRNEKNEEKAFQSTSNTSFKDEEYVNSTHSNLSSNFSNLSSTPSNLNSKFYFLSSNLTFIDHDSPEYEIKRLTDLKEAARVIFRRRLEQLDGVAQAVITGGLEREILIEVDPQKLTSYNISFNEIETALKSSNISMPAGSIMKGLFKYSLRTFGEYENLIDIKNTVIKQKNGRVILLSDIADVKDNFQEREGLTRLNASETVGLLIYKESDANTVSIAEKVKETIKTLQREYPEFNLIVVSDQSGFIKAAIENVKQEIFYGGILAVLVLFFFLGSFRNVFIIGITIPASLVLTVLLMYLFKINFNIISLGGIAVGVGMLLDNAIIVIENVVRYREQGLSIRQAALKGSSEVSMPIVAATLTTIAVFLPLIFVKGIAGELFKDQSYAIAFSLISSIFVALTLIPMLASRRSYISIKNYKSYEYLIFNKPKTFTTLNKILFWLKSPFILIIKSLQLVVLNSLSFLSQKVSFYFNEFYKVSNNWLEKIIIKYEQLLEWSLNNKKTVLIISFVLIILTILAAIDIKKEFIPPSEQDEFIVELIYPKGTSLRGNAILTSEIENAILSLPAVVNVVSNIGRVNEFDFLNKEQHSVNKTNLIVKLDLYTNYYDVLEKITKLFSNIGITTFSFKQVKSTYSDIIQPTENDIEIKVSNKNLDEAYYTANDLIQRLNKMKIEGISNLRLNNEKGIPEYRLTINENKCSAYGITINEVADRISFLVKGNEVTLFSDFDKKIPISLKTKSIERNNIDVILSQNFIKGNTKIPIKELVEVELANSFNEIWREDQNRTIYVYADVNNIGVDEAVKILREQINELPKKQDQTISVGGANEEIRSSFSQLYVALVISIFLMYMILAMEFESFLFPFIIIISVPLGLIGGILSLYILGESISIISIMGLIILVGIADNDAVVKVEFILRKREEGFNIHDSIMLAGKDRFRSIVMNSLTVMFALIPMIIGIGAGTQLRISLSLAIAGGLFSATFLTLIIIPVLYTYLERWSRKEVSLSTDGLEIRT